jgi:hypothetical protein
MENIEKFEKMSQENQRIAQQEKDLAKQAKEVGKSEIKRAKAREALVDKEFELTKIKRAWAEKKINLVIEKRDLKKKGFFEVEDLDLKTEEEVALYNQKIAIIQEQIADLNRDIAFLEKRIAKRMITLVDDKLFASKEREKLAKTQETYVKTLKEKQTQDKISVAENDMKLQEKAVNKARNYITEEEMGINQLQNELSNLKKKLSQKLSEREKIRLAQPSASDL